MLTFLTRSALMDGCCEGSSDYGQRDSSARLQQLSSLLPGQNFILTKTGVDMCWSVFAGRYLWTDQRVEPLDGLGVADDSVHAVHIQHNLPQSWGQRESTRITLNLQQREDSNCRLLLLVTRHSSPFLVLQRFAKQSIWEMQSRLQNRSITQEHQHL